MHALISTWISGYYSGHISNRDMVNFAVLLASAIIFLTKLGLPSTINRKFFVASAKNMVYRYGKQNKAGPLCHCLRGHISSQNIMIEDIICMCFQPAMIAMVKVKISFCHLMLIQTRPACLPSTISQFYTTLHVDSVASCACVYICFYIYLYIYIPAVLINYHTYELCD